MEKSRGFEDPLLVCSDGNPPLIKSIESNFPASYRQRCVKHREQNILDSVPKSEQGLIKVAIKNIFYGATSLPQAKQRQNSVDDLTLRIWKKLREDKIAMMDQLMLDLYIV